MAAQQVRDDAFRWTNANPAFAAGRGPVVCIDEGHHNFHTADGRYKPFAELLRGDGYVVNALKGKFTPPSLTACRVLAIANALSAENEDDWTYPHPSAFTRDEIRALAGWIRGGGSLLLIADHAPMAGAARDLGAVLGLVMIDAYADGGPGADVFRASAGTLRPHPIAQGRSPSERVDSVMTFTGQAAQITPGWEPLLVFGPEATANIALDQIFQSGPRDQRPQFPIAGWTHAATRSWDAGRIVFLGEAAMCSAQLAGPQRGAMGMNDPAAPQNPQFCLNTVRWLTRVLGK
jgi:hypothetical protein